MKNEILQKKENGINFLIQSCDNEDEQKLIFRLLEELVLLNSDKYNLLLNNMVNYIIDLHLDYNITQIAATAMDDEPDSSQTIVQAIKQKLADKEIEGFKLLNNFNKTVQYYHRGRVNIVVVDEFIGSGRTVINRIQAFKERITFDKEYKFHFVYMAGIEHYVNLLKNQGINIFCAYPLKRGISDNFINVELDKMISLMLNLESRLAPHIKNKYLNEHSFGWGHAEALYSAEDCLGNTPNSVFPIFWWKKDINNENRKTILTRYDPEPEQDI